MQVRPKPVRYSCRRDTRKFFSYTRSIGTAFIYFGRVATCRTHTNIIICIIYIIGTSRRIFYCTSTRLPLNG